MLAATSYNGYRRNVDEAVQLVAWLHIAGRQYSRYAGAAHRLGSDHWIPIVALAESAAAGRTELAIEVFRAADQLGMHRDHLRQRCLKLTACLDDPAPPLRVVRQKAIGVMPARRRPPRRLHSRWCTGWRRPRRRSTRPVTTLDASVRRAAKSWMGALIGCYSPGREFARQH